MSQKSSRRAFVKRSLGAAAIFGAPLVAIADDARESSGPKPAEAGGEAKTAAAAAKPTVSSAATTKNSRLNVALVGAGGQGRYDMGIVLSCKENVVAICDLDEKQIAAAYKEGGERAAGAKAYSDYRRLLEDAKSFDAVIIGTPDHWHAPLCTAFIKAGKHVYCEKPLTNTIADARALRELARSNSKVVTQMGNQGSAQNSLRRSVELIRAGALGQVREVHSWLNNRAPGRAQTVATDGDPIPPGFNWDFWCGPTAYRPFKKSIYHPFNWRNWYGFGNGPLADFCCHIYNTALRSLDLTYATKIEVAVKELDANGTSNHLTMHFPARGKLEPVALHWYDGGQHPPDELLKDVVEQYKKVPEHGCLIVGERGTIYTNPWNVGAMIKLADDPKLKDVLTHEPTKEIPQTLARNLNHVQEWIDACKGKGQTWSGFDFGGHLTEIGLTGVLALRVGHDVTWDGEATRCADAPEAAGIVKSKWRKAWLV